MKKRLSLIPIVLLMMVLGGMVCFASIIPPAGPGQIGYSSVVLCDSLSLRQEASFNSPSVQTLHYGDRPIVMEETNGWAHCVLGDSEDSPSGWIDTDFLAVDPSWYRTDDDTPVYAWNSTDAPKVALLDAGTTLPILRDDGNWIIVSLRGAAGWINNPGRSAATMYGNGSGSDSGSGSSSGGSDSGSSSGSGSGSESGGDVVTVYDENGEASTLYEGSDGIWRDRSGTEYVQVSDTQFQVKEGTRRVSTDYPSGGGGDDEDVVVAYDENGEAYTLYEGSDGIWRDGNGTEYLQVSDTQFQVKEGTKRLTV